MFRRFSAGQRRSAVGAVALMAVEAATALVVPILIGDLTNFLKDGKPWRPLGLRPSADATIPLLAVSIVVATAVNSLSEALSDVSLAKAGRVLGYNLRTALFSHLQKLSLAFHVRRSTGDVLTRITGDVQALEEFVVESVSDLLGSGLLLAGTLVYLFSQSWRIALLAVVIVPLLASVSSYFARRIKAASKELRAREGDLASTAAEMLTTISVVQAYGRARHEQKKFDSDSRHAMDAVLRTARLEALFSFTVSVMEALVIAVVVVLGARLVESDTVSAGLLVSFILLIQNMFKPTRRIIKEWNTVAKIYASVERISELLDREPAVQDTPGAREAPPLSGAVEFRDVSFAYQPQGPEDPDGEPARLTLQSVSFTLAAGEVVALVGHSGAGKSTIAQLLPRLYDPQSGAVLLDGHDIRTFTVDSLRAQISMVLQETILLRGTIAENIAYGREGATREDVVIAAQRAHAHDFITAMPEGYDTVLGERAATLSGGQRQRLAIARAFIRDTPILVLDEPTTGLDALSSAAVAEALQSLLRGRSAVIVSHDLNLIRGVDRILVLSGGRILEEGTPADLLERGGLYADLYASQFGEAAAELITSPAVAEPSLAGGESTFETVLLDAMPVPASEQQFRQLTGWVAGVAPALGGPDRDPRQSPVLTQTLPGLAEASDAQAMGPHLQRLLAPDWELDSCLLDKVLVDLGGGAGLRYRLRVRQRTSGEVEERRVAGRLLPTVEEAQAYAARLAAGAADLRSREDARAFARLVDVVAPLCLVLHSFPLDPDLPGLVAATDPARMATVLEPVLPSAGHGLELQSCRPEVVKYALGGQCVLRYELLWRVQPSRRTVRQVVYGKVYSDERGSHIAPTLTALHERLHAERAPRPFLLPRFQGYLPGLRLALLEALPGTPQVPDLVRSWVAGERASGPTALTAESALATCARIAGALHAPAPDALVLPGAASGGQDRTLQGELDSVQHDLEALAAYAPALAALLEGRLAALAPVARAGGLPMLTTHGDFAPSEVLFDGPLSGVYDLDAACAAEPARDLGQFAAHLSLVAARAARIAGAPVTERGQSLERVFLGEYLQARPDLDREALWGVAGAYRTLTLVRVAARSWRQLKPERLQLAVSLLQEPQPAPRQRQYT